MGVGSFEGYVVTLDFGAGRFRLRKGNLPSPDKNGVVGYSGAIPRVTLAIGGRTYTADVDTGNSVAAIVASESVAKAINPNSTWTSLGTAHALDADMEMFQSSLMHEAFIGETPLRGLNIAYPALLPVVNIGARAFEGLVLELDVSNHRVRIRGSPNLAQK